MVPRWSRWSSGAVENAGDFVGVADDIEDAHATAALAADGHVDGEHSGEQVGPTETARCTARVEATFFVDVQQVVRGVADPEAALQTQLQDFMHANWAFGPPLPELYCDRRALRPGPPWSSLHAKCAAVDGKRAFLSSANFTSRGQERNIEAGALIHDATFAVQLERQWLGLIKAGLVLRWDRL